MSAFADTAPHHRMHEPTRAQEAAADQADADMLASSVGGLCHGLTDYLGAMLDRREDEWREEHYPTLVEIRALLTKAATVAEGLAA